MIRHLRAGIACAVLALLQLTACGGGGSNNPVFTPLPPATTSPPPSEPPPAATSPLQRATVYGSILGTDDAATNGTYSWKGVPFAKPPVGELRWKAPVDPTPWTAVKTTQKLGNACVQTGRLYGPGQNNQYDATIGTSIGKTTGSEDCLYLNIWAPSTAKATDKLPVIVFVYGGSNITGYTGDPVYNGAALAKAANAVVVTVNYRLGIMGFLASPQLKAGLDANDDSGNYAILDLIKGMKFVNANIAAFGGDPANVTLMGQSAGAVNIYALMVSPLVANAKPALFQRLVPLSGGVATATTKPNQVNALLSALLVADGTVADDAAAATYIARQSNADLAAYLRSKSADTLLQTVLKKLAPLGLSASNPLNDGTVVPVDPIAAINAGQFLKVPVMAGYTRDETKLFPQNLATSPAFGGISGRLLDDPTVFAMAYSYDPNAAPTTSLEQWIPGQYLPVTTPVTGFNARTDLYNQYFFIALRKQIFPVLQAQNVPLWWYQFNWDKSPAPFNDIFGAAHTFDLPFVFGNFGPSLYSKFANSKANEPGRLELSDAMMKSLAAFARSGDPNNAALGVNWPQYPAMLNFDASLSAKAITVQ
ncbi:para-nitrobenzyl esterase [Variovorax boronicumulans]|uniref:carboxylesterase/lipase family protein n=1 Tax=Variovorax boronicumulans TaxID=436515 RepID=UPI00278B7FD4|nr:carboxylesterase family protein [Variovorax boronicumulans]MDQ0012026.1 para-nitrobenzyl esterase [Variovorax boronicumulans]